MKISTLLSCIILCSSILFAESLEYIAVAPFFSEGITENQASSYTETFRRMYNAVAKYKVMERSKMDQILKSEGFERTDIVSDISYGLALCRLLSVQYVILGKVTKSEETITCNFKVIDLETKKCIHEITRRIDESIRGAPKKLLRVMIPKIVETIDPVIEKSAKKRLLQ